MENKPITDEMVVKRANAAVRLALERNKALDVPSIIYDRKTKKICELRPDGEIVPVADRLLKGNYSERIHEKA